MATLSFRARPRTARALIGALSHSVLGYTLSALALGVHFAMYSGTMDAVVYDTVLEESGTSAAFELRNGWSRAQLWSAARCSAAGWPA